MRLALFGTGEECSALRILLQQLVKELELVTYNKQEELIAGIVQQPCDVAFILHNSASGMEGVIATRKLFPQLPLIWLSDDRAFAAQSYRLHVNWFGVKPCTRESLQQALQKCGVS